MTTEYEQFEILEESVLALRVVFDRIETKLGRLESNVEILRDLYEDRQRRDNDKNLHIA
jgi:hypothetical protein